MLCRGYCRIVVCGLLFLLSPAVAVASLQPLDDLQLAGLTGQSGFAIGFDRLGFNIAIKTLYYGDDDGVPGVSAGAYLSLCGISLLGSIGADEPIIIALETGLDPYGGNQVTSLLFNIRDVTIRVDHFTIDAIRVGPEPGLGPSFGSLGIYNMVTRLSGNLRIWAH